MNFRTALSELCNGHTDVCELVRRNNLNSEQAMALKALSMKVSEASRTASPSSFVASMMA